MSRLVSMMVAVLVVSGGASTLLAARDGDGTKDWQALKAEQRRLEAEMRRMATRLPEVQYLASQLDGLRLATLSPRGDVGQARRLAEIGQRIRDARLRELVRALAASIDGQPGASDGEKEALLLLTLELESSLTELRRVRDQVAAVRKELTYWVEPETKRRMLRHAGSLVGDGRAVGRLEASLAELEAQELAERDLCARDAARSRSPLRELRGRIATQRKEVELARARADLAGTIQATLADDLLDDAERVRLTRSQAVVERLAAMIRGVETERW